MHYGQSVSCRWRFIAQAFGEDFDRDCGHCDACLHGAKWIVAHGAEAPG